MPRAAFNLTRDLGGAVGLSLINTLIDQRGFAFASPARKHLLWPRRADETLERLTHRYSSRGADAPLAATAKLAQMGRRDALVMALGDVFLALTVRFFALVVVTYFMRRPALATVAEAH